MEFHHHIYLKEDKHYYSVPHRFTGKKVKTIYTTRMVEIYHDNVRVALHQRDYKIYGYTTIEEHMPAAHQFVEGWNTERFTAWASNIGGSVETFIGLLIESKEHPQQAFKACLGVLNLGKKYKNQDMEKVCKRALAYNTITFRFIDNALKNNVHKMDEDTEVNLRLPLHKNIRGRENYK